jgi:photoactive yellow protein
MLAQEKLAPAAAGFADVSIADLERLSPAERDELPFGVIGVAPSTEVEIYNKTESRIAGLSQDHTIGKFMFTVVAPCMNNYLVAQRFENEPELDAIVPYVLTLRMKPTPVRLRLLSTASTRRRYILVERR